MIINTTPIQVPRVFASEQASCLAGAGKKNIHKTQKLLCSRYFSPLFLNWKYWLIFHFYGDPGAFSGPFVKNQMARIRFCHASISQKFWNWRPPPFLAPVSPKCIYIFCYASLPCISNMDVLLSFTKTACTAVALHMYMVSMNRSSVSFMPGILGQFWR